MSLDITIYGRTVSIVNIYSPNLKHEQFIFIEELHRALYDKKILIFGGDFNNNFENDSEKGLEKKWNDLNKLFLLDEASKPDKNEDRFLFTWTNGHQFSRIDRLYLKKSCDQQMKYIDCISNSISDHKILIAELSFLKLFKKSKFKKNSDWKLNEQILENEIVNRFILNKCSDIPMLIYHHQKDWYDF